MLKELFTNNFKGEEDRVMNDTYLFIDYREASTEYELKVVEPGLAYRYQGNFYGLLKELTVPDYLYMNTLYINKLVSPLDYKGEGGVVKIAKSLNLPKQ